MRTAQLSRRPLREVINQPVHGVGVRADCPRRVPHQRAPLFFPARIFRRGLATFSRRRAGRRVCRRRRIGPRIFQRGLATSSRRRRGLATSSRRRAFRRVRRRRPLPDDASCHILPSQPLLPLRRKPLGSLYDMWGQPLDIMWGRPFPPRSALATVRANLPIPVLPIPVCAVNAFPAYLSRPDRHAARPGPRPRASRGVARARQHLEPQVATVMCKRGEGRARFVSSSFDSFRPRPPPPHRPRPGGAPSRFQGW